jgi:hypothetical protein
MLLILFLSPISVFAMEWARTYGVNNRDYASSIQQTADGGYIVAGRTGFEDDSTGEDYYDIWVLKLDSNGDISWQKTYDMNNYDYASSIQQTADGGYIVAGAAAENNIIRSPDYAYFSDILVLKLDSSGEISWQKTYGGSNDAGASSIQQTADGGYIVAGYTGKYIPGGYPYLYDIWILKLDSSGNISWQKTYGGSYYDVSRSIQQTADGGYIVDGFTDVCGGLCFGMLVLKLDSSGNVSWQKVYNDSDMDSWETGSSIRQTADGGYVLAVPSWNGRVLITTTWLLKLDSSGDISWQKTYGGGENEDYSASSIQQTTDGGYIVAGYTAGYTGDYYYYDSDVLVLKLNSRGEIPGCDIMHTNDAIIDILSFSVQDTNITSQTSNAAILSPGVSPQNSSAEISTLCETSSCTFRDKENHSLEVIGAAADGVSQVIIQINDLPADVTIADIQIAVPEEDGHLENNKALNNGVFTQTYTAQTYFVRSGHSEDLSQGKREINLTIKVNGQEIPHDPFYLFKPPLVLIHGLWSDSGTWNVLINY